MAARPLVKVAVGSAKGFAAAALIGLGKPGSAIGGLARRAPALAPFVSREYRVALG